MPDVVRSAIFRASDFVWGPWNTPIGPIPGPLMILLILTGLFLTIRTGVVQVRRFPEAARTIVPEQAAGAAGRAVAVPGVHDGAGRVDRHRQHRRRRDGHRVGRPRGALLDLGVRLHRDGDQVRGGRARHALPRGARAAAVRRARCTTCATGCARRGWPRVFAAVAGLAALFTTPFTQPNSMAVVLKSQFGVPTWAAGIAIAVLTWLVIIGGVKSIGRAAEKLSPLKVGLYLAGGLFVILSHASQIPGVIALVFREAFSFRAAVGSSAGLGIVMAMRYGLARGIYANEAGYGTAAVAYGTARSTSPTQQGLNAVIEVFVVSFVTSSISALTILVSGVWQSGQTSTAVVAQAFNTAIPVAGGWVVAFCAFLFGYTTLIGWAYYGEQFFEYLFGRRVTVPYRWIYCLLIPIGAVASVETVWAWGDLMNGLQVFPNLVGLVGLSGIVAAAARVDGQAEPEAEARQKRLERCRARVRQVHRQQRPRPPVALGLGQLRLDPEFFADDVGELRGMGRRQHDDRRAGARRAAGTSAPPSTRRRCADRGSRPSPGKRRGSPRASPPPTRACRRSRRPSARRRAVQRGEPREVARVADVHRVRQRRDRRAAAGRRPSPGTRAARRWRWWRRRSATTGSPMRAAMTPAVRLPRLPDGTEKTTASPVRAATSR